MLETLLTVLYETGENADKLKLQSFVTSLNPSYGLTKVNLLPLFTNKTGEEALQDWLLDRFALSIKINSR